jgi:hypothetical protein
MTDDDELRLKRSPRNGRFKPGVSGNPCGRPKGSHNSANRSHPVDEKEDSCPRKRKGSKSPKAGSDAVAPL